MKLRIRSKHSKPRILFLAEDVALSHVVRPLVLADAVKTRCDVTLATGERYAHLVRERNLPYRKVWTVPSDTFVSRLAQGKDAWTSEDFIREVQENIALVDELSPDLVIGDLRLSLGISSEVSKIPYISLINAYWSPYCTLIPPPSELPFERILGVTLSALLLPRIAPFILKRLAAPFNTVRRRYNLNPVREYREMFTCATWTWYMDIPSLVPTRDTPSNHAYLGPVFWSPDIALPEWWDRLPKDRPVAYVTMGSTGKTTFIADIIDELNKMDMTVLLATSGRFEQKHLPGKVYAADYLPGIEACRRSAFIVCNGGTGAIYQAIYSGTPILGIPTNGDQYFAIGAVAEKGAGLFIRSTHVNRKRIRNTVSKLMSDQSFVDTCNQLKKEVSEYDAIQKFSQFIESIWQYKKPTLK